MTSRSLPAMLFPGLLTLLAACGGDGFGGRSGSRFEVVDEGSASGVTSTLSGPGEAFPIAQTQPLTNTSMDTTTAFDAIDPTATAGVVMPDGSVYDPNYPPNYPPPVYSERRRAASPPRPRPPVQSVPRDDAEEIDPGSTPDEPREPVPPEGTATVSPEETREPVEPAEPAPPPPDDPDAR